ncbi:hypothetical protein [Pseudofulvibacter geojedonensis]|uniref:Tetratricopeptide repeat protein n=1 Tax=Pseudofulvibacter geojedonensis TaxID=1123758 RepID=A0ABW3I352_9FLAO
MNIQDFTNILQQPQGINEAQTIQLKEILNQYPYFQAARAIHLGGLKNQDSYFYNQELKKTAAYTTDRSILFDYITSENFNQNNISKSLQEQQESIKNIEVVNPVEISSFESATAPYDKAVTEPDLFEEKIEENKIAVASEKLGIGKPLEFNPSETHSFQEWLQLAQVKPIERKEVKSEVNADVSDKKEASKFDLIDKFIATNPKISPVKKTVSLTNLAKENNFNSDELMTETLAKVYLEQKNYKKAKQAYRILSLKYPEKSSFFADRIREIKKLENQ